MQPLAREFSVLHENRVDFSFDSSDQQWFARAV